MIPNAENMIGLVKAQVIIDHATQCLQTATEDLERFILDGNDRHAHDRMTACVRVRKLIHGDEDVKRDLVEALIELYEMGKYYPAASLGVFWSEMTRAAILVVRLAR